MDWKTESELFNQAADIYDRYRPSYPEEIINTLIRETHLSADSKLLEVGAGSGKATELFVNKGYNILCIDPGADLVAIGNSRFQKENFRFIQGRFEEIDISPKSFDTIFSAQAFHWIPQPAGFTKCAYALKDQGFLALFWNMYITYDNELDHELLSISGKYGGFADFLSAAGCEERIQSITDGIGNCGLFTKSQITRVLWQQTCTAEEYYGFVLTGNNFIKKSESEKQSAYHDIVQLANKHNGYIKRPYLCVLYIAKKL